ncbi:MAG: T9SS type A sorting domain-containing protein, partial [Bacteroidetes bacterium]|nr:T9SS type A sorting domain-containing protein [Bacteroidota bacterium]
PEFGYGVNSAYGKVAYRFKLNIKDTLRAVRMYFNRTEGNANDQYFDLAVWRDNDGEPGEIIHLSKDMKPKFSNNLYQIQTYYFENPVPVNSIFYIGWIQSTSENLNVGFDAYNDASSNIYYNVTGEWIKTSNTGSLIMRPVIGKKFDPAGIINDKPLSNDLLVFPNPSTNGKLHIRLPDHYQYRIQRAETNISIFNVYGQIIFTSPYKETIDISGLSNGMYIIRLNYNSNKLIFTGKVLVNR